MSWTRMPQRPISVPSSRSVVAHRPNLCSRSAAMIHSSPVRVFSRVRGPPRNRIVYGSAGNAASASRSSSCSGRSTRRAVLSTSVPALVLPMLRYASGVSTAVVTGGAGFLGSHLCEYLLARDWRVICLDNLDTGSLENIEGLRGEAFDFRYHNCVEFIDVAEPVDVLFHLASPASPVDYLRLPLATLKVGSYGTHNALGLAKFKRARFLIASTSEVYGDPEMHPQQEEYWGNVNPVGPRGVYDEAKRYAEAMTMAYHRQQGVDTHIARIFNTYGPRMRQHDGRAIPNFLSQALAGKPITVFGDGSQTRSFCYVDDLIEGLFRLAMSDYHLPVNVGNPNEMSLLELAEKIVTLTGTRSEIVFEGLPIDDPKVRQPDITRAREILGWEPKVTLDEGLRRKIESLGRTPVAA